MDKAEAIRELDDLIKAETEKVSLFAHNYATAFSEEENAREAACQLDYAFFHCWLRRRLLQARDRLMGLAHDEVVSALIREAEEAHTMHTVQDFPRGELARLRAARAFAEWRAAGEFHKPGVDDTEHCLELLYSLPVGEREKLIEKHRKPPFLSLPEDRDFMVAVCVRSPE